MILCSWQIKTNKIDFKDSYDICSSNLYIVLSICLLIGGARSILRFLCFLIFSTSFQDRRLLFSGFKQIHSLHIFLGMAIRLIFGPDSDSYKNPSKNKTDSPQIPDSYFFWRIPDSSNILNGITFYGKNLKLRFSYFHSSFFPISRPCSGHFLTLTQPNLT